MVYGDISDSPPHSLYYMRNIPNVEYFLATTEEEQGDSSIPLDLSVA